MLNAVLTVRGGTANSHKKKGWEAFTDAAISAVSSRCAPGVVFMLWGKPAQVRFAIAHGTVQSCSLAMWGVHAVQVRAGACVYILWAKHFHIIHRGL